MTQYKVTIYVSAAYITYVTAENLEDAINPTVDKAFLELEKTTLQDYEVEETYAEEVVQ